VAVSRDVGELPKPLATAPPMDAVDGGTTSRTERWERTRVGSAPGDTALNATP
jgi:hypothetical protein